jgi:hypothetical protein
MGKMTKRILMALTILIIIIIQFFRIDKSVPETDPAMDFFVVTNPPRRVIAMFRNSCYDCHSYKTVYPWYSGIAPVSWVLQGHIRDARKELNFSEYGNYSREKRNSALSEMKEVIAEREMPLKSYTLVHRKARLDKDMRESMTRWLSEGKNAIQAP